MKYSTFYSRFSKSTLTALLLVSAIGKIAAQTDKIPGGVNFKTVFNKNGTTLGYSPASGVKVLTVDWFKF